MNDAYNTLTARFLDRSTLAQLTDAASDGQRVEIERFSKAYPGGFAECSLLIQRDPLLPLSFGLGDRLQILNGPRIVWEGDITSIEHYATDSSQGVRIMAVGVWGTVTARTTSKVWADNRMGADTWTEPTTALSGVDKTPDRVISIDRTSGRLRWTPKAEAFTLNWFHRARYRMPTSQTVKRFKGSYTLQEGAQAWEIGWINQTTTGVEWSVNASGSGTFDVTLTTPSNEIWAYLAARAAQTPKSDGTYYGQIDDAASGATQFMVYGETGNINCYEIFRDVRGYISELSADESLIDGSLTVSVEPFFAQGREAYRSILARIAGYGTSSYGPIGYGIRESSLSNDGKPILYCEPWPALTDYEYQVSVRDAAGGVRVVRDIGGVANWIVVTYQDALGDTTTLTPDDDATLKDQTSIDAYGERHMLLNLGQIGSTPSISYARAVLSVAKDPQVYISGSLRFAGYLTAKSGERVPAANVREGERVKIVDFISDVLDVSGAGLTAVITLAEYSDADGGSVSLSFGVPNKLTIMLARTPTIKPSYYHVVAGGSRERR